jgi:hypothetical protein
MERRSPPERFSGSCGHPGEGAAQPSGPTTQDVTFHCGQKRASRRRFVPLRLPCQTASPSAALSVRDVSGPVVVPPKALRSMPMSWMDSKPQDPCARRTPLSPPSAGRVSPSPTPDPGTPSPATPPPSEPPAPDPPSYPPFPTEPVEKGLDHPDRETRSAMDRGELGWAIMLAPGSSQ